MASKRLHELDTALGAALDACAAGPTARRSPLSFEEEVTAHADTNKLPGLAFRLACSALEGEGPVGAVLETLEK